MLLIIAFMLANLWAFSLVFAQKKNKVLEWRDTAISDYIKHSSELQMGFGFLSLSFCLLALEFYGQFAAWLFAASAAGSAGVALTRYKLSGWPHIASAIITYAAAIGGALCVSSGALYGIALANAFYAAAGRLLGDETGDYERYLAFGLIFWMGCAAWGI